MCKKRMKKVKTIIFDLGGVLIDYSLERSVEQFRKLGYREMDKLINPYRQSGVLLELEKGEAPPQALYDEIDRSVGRHVDPRAIDAALCSFLIDIPDYKLDMLLDLKRRGYELFMLSNTNPIMMNYMKEGVFRKQGLGIGDYFDRLFLSYEMGLVKPYPEIFRRMIDLTGIVPGQTLFIDDSPENAATGRSLGFDTYEARQHEDFRSLFDGYEPLRRLPAGTTE